MKYVMSENNILFRKILHSDFCNEFLFNSKKKRQRFSFFSVFSNKFQFKSSKFLYTYIRLHLSVLINVSLTFRIPICSPSYVTNQLYIHG